MEKFNNEIIERLKEDSWNEENDSWMNERNCMALIKKIESYFDEKKDMPIPEKYINVQLTLNKKDIQNIRFRYKNQIISGVFVVDAIELIFGKYRKDIIIKFGVRDEMAPMLCIIQPPISYDYEFIIAPRYCEDLDNEDDKDYFDIEKNGTSKINYRVKRYEI